MSQVTSLKAGKAAVDVSAKARSWLAPEANNQPKAETTARNFW